ncbi:MAG TPA: PadR family transcriptional regulator [Mycobacteriales bacterium]
MRLGRGDIRPLLLVGLADGSAHGYELMRRLEEASGGAWTPSPGSVYPTLQLLEDEGLLTCSSAGGKKVYTLTTSGRHAARAAAKSPRPWDQEDAQPGRYPLREITHAVHAAAKQVGATGSPEQIDAAIELLRRAKKDLYLLLAGD